MKHFYKISATLAAVFVTVILFAVSAFAQGEATAATTLKVENTAEGISVSWTSVEDIYYYELYRQSNDGNEEVLLSKAQDTQFMDTTAQPGVVYGYRVVPMTTDETKSQESSVVTIYRVGAPEITSYQATDDGLKIEWTKLAEAEGYYVVRRTESGNKWETVSKCSAETTSFTDKNASDDEKYVYAVRAYGKSFLGAASNQVTVGLFARPKIISVASTEKGIALKWTTVPTAAYYIVYRREATSDAEWKPYALLDAEYDIYHDTEIKSGVVYNYIVRAADAAGQLSSYGEEVSMRHLKKPVISSAESSTNGIKLRWSISEGANGYGIFRKDYNSDNWALVAVVKGETTLEYTDGKVLNSRAYTYTVRAIWNKNLSAYDEKGVTIRFLEAPQSLLCDPDTASGNVLTWKNNSEASLFIVYRKAANGKWTPLAITNENKYADKKADPDVLYYYTVQAYTGSTYISGFAVIVATREATSYDKDAKLIALTYDDGPSDSVTNGVLDILETYGAKATFFVVGENIEYGSAAMTRAAQMGCEIGTHTYSHIDLPTSSEEEIREEIQLTDELVKKYTGQATKIARAPGGAIDEASGAIVNKPFYYWTVDTRDWESRDPESIIEIIQTNVSEGDIILMHDIYDTTLSASELIIPWLISEGYELVTVSELMAHYDVSVQPGVTYYNGFGATAYTD